MKISRRRFLEAGPALPLVVGVPGPAEAGPHGSQGQEYDPQGSDHRDDPQGSYHINDPKGSYHTSFDPWVELNGAHVRHNVEGIAGLTKRRILAVIKNNGYGAGVANIARLLEPLAPIHGYAVVKIDEAFTLRDAGLHKPILLMGPFDERHIRDLAAREIMPMVYTPPGAELERTAARLRRPVAMHVCVDTGIGRVGVPHREAAEFVRTLHRRSASLVDGIMMTFTEDPEFDREQISRFTALVDRLAADRIQIGRRHAASSYALFQGGQTTFLDMVRPGMALFGVYSEPPFRTAGILDLKPALALRARVVYVKQLREGDSAGYSRAYTAQRDVWVATLPVGHADGVPRAAAKGAKVRIGGALYPIVASVSASHSIVEIGAEPAVKIGDVATIFDWEEGSRPEDVSAACGASVYDLLMHLSPLVERRVI